MRYKIYNDNKLTVETLSEKPRNTAKSVVRRKAEKERHE